jgi:glycosyltransferase involved in cell wall biosynthesis
MLPAQRIVTVWSAGQAALQEIVGDGRVELIDNGARVEGLPEPEGPHDPPRVLYVGLLTERKGVVDLAAASQILHERGVLHELWLLGGTPDEGPDAEQRVRTQLNDRVRLLGTREPAEMADVYAQADVFCLPSWWEAMPLSVLEAMASGLPVVATDVGDVSRQVLHGRTGYVVPPHAPQELANALQLLLGDAERRRAMGAAGRQHVTRVFSFNRTVERLSEAYARIAADQRRVTAKQGVGGRRWMQRSSQSARRGLRR